MRVIAHDPFVWSPEDGTEMVDFETLCVDSDVLSLHAPLAPDTAGYLR